MSLKGNDLSKLYYSIGEVAEMFGVNASLIRFWEKEFAIIKPKKNKKGNRLFTKKDIENLQRIYHLVKEKGFTLEGAKQELKKKDSEHEVVNDNGPVIQKLEHIKSDLMKLSREL